MNTSQNDLPPIEWQDPPEESEPAFKEVTTLTPFEEGCRHVPKSQRTQIPKETAGTLKSRPTYTSFGTDGTTASVSAYGHILQITQFLGHGRSGLFCANTVRINSPSHPSKRANDLLSLSTSPDSGIQIGWKEALDELYDFNPAKPLLEFVYDRWPRFTFDLKSSIPNASNDSSDKEQKTPFKPPKLSLQYFCSHGTVMQQYVFEHKDQDTRERGISQLKLSTDLDIRNLDFTKNTQYNEARSEGYLRKPGPHNFGLIIVSKLSLEDAKEMGIDETEYKSAPGPKAFGLVITPFANGVAQKVKNSEGAWYIDLSPQVQQSFEKNGILDVTIAYRLQALKTYQSWKSSIVPVDHLACMIKTFSAGSDAPNKSDASDGSNAANKSYTPFVRLQFSSHPQLDFVIRRNLEHILSVCSIPVPRVRSNSSEDVPAGRLDKEAISIALTCGDISGHRVEGSASFFAFQFLRSVYAFLNEPQYLPESQHWCEERQDCQCLKPIKNYVDCLQKRILDVCRSHVDWICETAQATHNGQFSSRYWVTGKTIQNPSYLPPSLVDSPLQLIKVSDFFSDLKTRIMPVRLPYPKTNNLKPKIRSWVVDLDGKNARGTFAFSRLQLPGEPKFRLSDHMWICQAIKSVELLKLDEELEPHETRMKRLKDELSSHKKFIELIDNAIVATDLERRRTALEHRKAERELEVRRLEKELQTLKKEVEEDGQIQRGRVYNTYSFDDIKKKVLKRFTTEHPILRKRTLTTCRTSSESRFLFHSKDAVLFHSTASAFFDGDDTTKGSKRKGEKSDLWTNLVKAQSYQDEYQDLDRQNPLWKALIFIMSAQDQRGGIASSDKARELASRTLFSSSSPNGLFTGTVIDQSEPLDDYWHVAFEVPYVLLKYGKDVLESEVPARYLNKTTSATAASGGSGSIEQIVPKFVPFFNFSNLIDRKSLVEVSDSWLQPLPPSLDFESSGADSDFSDIQLKELSKIGTVIDIPKHSNGEEIDESKLAPNKDILTVLRRRRNLLHAKKRFIWIPNVEEPIAAICQKTSTHLERGNMTAFFKRHDSHDKYFFDSASTALNEWETEIHMSFFRIYELSSEETRKFLEKNARGTPRVSFVKLKEREAHGSRLASSKFEEKETTFLRSTISFRFTGDMFNDYWTCHFLEHNFLNHRILMSGGKETDWTLAERLTKLKELKDANPKKIQMSCWQERKVLELLLFNQMLEEVQSCTENILEWVKKRVFQSLEHEDKATEDAALRVKVVSLLRKQSSVEATEPFNVLTEALQGAIKLLQQGRSENYFSIIERWRLFEQTLQAMEDDLDGNLVRIKEWHRREEDRKSEKPRWTLKDEKRYCAIITKLTLESQRKTIELESLKGSMAAFRGSLNDRLASIRDDISFRGSENINLFTYVTVVFMPLGFATGIFSMGEAPQHATLIGMVVTSVVSLMATVLALVNAKTMARILVEPIISISCWMARMLLYPVIYLVCLLLRPLLVDKPNISEPFEDALLSLSNLDPVKRARDDHEKHFGKSNKTTGSSDVKVSDPKESSGGASSTEGSTGFPSNRNSRTKLSDLESGNGV